MHCQEGKKVYLALLRTQIDLELCRTTPFLFPPVIRSLNRPTSFNGFSSRTISCIHRALSACIFIPVLRAWCHQCTKAWNSNWAWLCSFRHAILSHPGPIQAHASNVCMLSKHLHCLTSKHLDIHLCDNWSSSWQEVWHKVWILLSSVY